MKKFITTILVLLLLSNQAFASTDGVDISDSTIDNLVLDQSADNNNLSADEPLITTTNILEMTQSAIPVPFVKNLVTWILNGLKIPISPAFPTVIASVAIEYGIDYTFDKVFYKTCINNFDELSNELTDKICSADNPLDYEKEMKAELGHIEILKQIKIIEEENQQLVTNEYFQYVSIF